MRALALVALLPALAHAEAVREPRYETGPTFEVVDGEAREMTPGRRRCDEALFDPVPTPVRDAALDAQRGACLRSALHVELVPTALIDTPGFHGELETSLYLHVQFRLPRALAVSAGLRPVRALFVQNAVNKALEAQTGPLVVGVAWGRSYAASAIAIQSELELPATRFANLETTHLAGALTLATTHRLSERATLHGRLGAVAARAWSAGGTTERLALRAGLDVVRRVGARWALGAGAELQAGWYGGFDGITPRLGAQRRFGERWRGQLGLGLPLGGDERKNAILLVGVVHDVE